MIQDEKQLKKTIKRKMMKVLCEVQRILEGEEVHIPEDKIPAMVRKGVLDALEAEVASGNLGPDLLEEAREKMQVRIDWETGLIDVEVE
jgi:hypothetical protein